MLSGLGALPLRRDMRSLMRRAVPAQAWANVTASRAVGTTYTNTTGQTIQVSIVCTSGVGTALGPALTVAGLAVSFVFHVLAPGEQTSATVSALVPPGATYSLALATGTFAWYEMR